MYNLAKQARSAAADLDHSFMPRKLAGKRVLITGVESALGQAIARRFAWEGAHVALLSSAGIPDALRQSIQQMRRICVTINGDMRELDTCDRALDEALTAFDGLDILVNNPPERDSAMVGGVPPLAFATLYLTRNALRVMDAGGAIINTAFDDTVPAFTRSLAQVAAKHGVRVNAVAPAPLPPLTAANQDLRPATAPAPIAEDDLATSFVFLASSESAGMNGQLIDAADFVSVA
ncbi:MULTISPECIES: SDR family oxidoreductase [Asticcacaulis]|uniref:SDR family oxidoreductase n=1 Tax=Asticcacaulis TaxID=76890 RepID=UPI001AE67FC2|nr:MULTISPECIES: SDR family oxidoreductase [Asticcacaulis]MBP2161455.1 NAD(P)-dependent dehydrogenase (short-subunit alcohol dehydrogenase family) [Asticcacaulis solisilvae]MDR6802500.1 NAD(P)-dependent dehydrogenase (short-subunit alcohol dehydrogenase family) [Asticcacaulis sp. BE141]